MLESDELRCLVLYALPFLVYFGISAYHGLGPKRENSRPLPRGSYLLFYWNLAIGVVLPVTDCSNSTSISASRGKKRSTLEPNLIKPN